MKFSDRLGQMSPSATRAVAEKAKALKARGVPITSFTTGQPDFNAPRASRQYASRAMASGQTFYTATGGIGELKSAVKDYYRDRFGLEYGHNEIISAPGAKPLVFEALAALVNPGDEVLLTSPSWVSYHEQIRFFGGRPVIVETMEKTFELDLERFRKAVTEKTVAILINSPHNPTGVVYGPEAIQGLCALAREHDLTIINDEIYERITFDGLDYRNPLCCCPEAREHVLNINGMSKAYAMTGWRIGFALGPEKLVQRMGALQGHLTSCACSVAQWAAVGAIRDAQPEVAAMVAEYQKRKDMVTAALDEMPLLSYVRPRGAFYVFLDIRKTLGRSSGGCKITSDIDFARLLLENNHVAVVPGAAFLLPGHVRISFATSREEIKDGMEKLKRFLDHLS